MNLIMDIIRLEHPELFAIELGKITELDFVYTLASTNIDQSIPNLIKMNTNIRSRISSIMDLIRPELSELSVLEFEKLQYLIFFFFFFFLNPASANIDHSAPNLVTIYMTNRSRISLIMGIIGPERLELFAIELEKKKKKIAEFDIVYTLASTNINRSAQNFVEMYVTIRSRMNYTMDLIRAEHLQVHVSALELEKLL